MKLKHYVIALNLLFIILALSSCASTDPAVRYAKKHSGMSYHEAMKDNSSFTMKSLKDDRKTLKSEIRDNRKKRGHNSKKDRLKNELIELRAKAEENK